MADWGRKLFLGTTNPQHPALQVKKERDDIEIISFAKKLNFPQLMRILKQEHGIEKLTIQSGGTLNAQWVRLGLVDPLSVVIAPCLIGGMETATLVDGASLLNQHDLKHIKALVMCLHFAGYLTLCSSLLSCQDQTHQKTKLIFRNSSF